MKIFIVVCMMVAVTLAQSDHHDHHEHDHHDHHEHDHEERHRMAEDLIKRGHALLHLIRETLEKHHGNEHLLDAIQHQAVLVEALVKDLESQHKVENVMELHHIHLIEEDLLHYENRVSEEIAILMHERHHEHHGGEELIRRGEELLRQAQDVVEKHRHHGDRELEAIEHEMHAVHHLLEEIRKRPEGHDFQREEEALKRHEDSLKNLLERVHHRHHHHDEHHHDEDHHEHHHEENHHEHHHEDDN